MPSKQLQQEGSWPHLNFVPCCWPCQQVYFSRMMYLHQLWLLWLTSYRMTTPSSFPHRYFPYRFQCIRIMNRITNVMILLMRNCFLDMLGKHSRSIRRIVAHQCFICWSISTISLLIRGTFFTPGHLHRTLTTSKAANEEVLEQVAAPIISSSHHIIHAG